MHQLIKVLVSRSALAAGVLVLLAAAFAPGAEAVAVVTFSPLNGVINGPADTLTVDVTVDAGAVDLRGFTFVFEFDPAVVAPVSVDAGPLVTGAACPHFVNWLNEGAVGDSISVDAATLGCSVSGPGAILRMKFVGVEQGLSPIACRSGEMRDSANQPIAHTCLDGTILYVGPTAARPSSWGKVKCVYR